MKDFIQNIDWQFLLLIATLAIEFAFLVRFSEAYNRVGHFPGNKSKGVLSEISGFFDFIVLKHPFSNVFITLILLLGLFGLLCLLYCLGLGLDSFFNSSRIRPFGATLLASTCLITFLILAYYRIFRQSLDPKTLSDYDKVKKFVFVREEIPISFKLRFAKLEKKYLAAFNLSGVDLVSSDLSFADLRAANLSRGNFMYSNLVAADLREANLNYINLEGAKLSSSFLQRSTLIGANLKNVDLSGADLSGADLTDADLSNAILSNTKLNQTNLTGTKISVDF